MTSMYSTPWIRSINIPVEDGGGHVLLKHTVLIEGGNHYHIEVHQPTTARSIVVTSNTLESALTYALVDTLKALIRETGKDS